ncbi:MAG: LysR family transcriptional regulator [Rhodospirillales bacterium]|nr:MAG: LysR family transcriptional regulator [Rhodospirillales bacterium]
MTPSQIRAFHLVAREGGFTGAARAANISQPTLSGQVKALETAYGVRLFERRGRQTRPTELGRRLFDVTVRLFAAGDEAEALLSGSAAAEPAHLRIGADSAYHVMPVLAELRRRQAGLTFGLRIGNSTEVMREILAREVDVGVMARPTSDPRVHAVQVRRDRLVLFVAAGHPWWRRRTLRLAELAGRDLVLRERGSITRETFERALAEAGVRPGALVEVETREGVREAVAAGFGVGVVFDSEFGVDARFQALRVADTDLAVGEFAVCLRDRRSIAPIRAFLEIAAALAAPRTPARGVTKL